MSGGSVGMKHAATIQVLPTKTEKSKSVHQEIRRRYGKSIARQPIDDMWHKALASQEKYQLDEPGLWTFNGRDALLDCYQDLLDSTIYFMQYCMESEESNYTGSIDRERLMAAMLAACQAIREELVEQGDFK